MSRGACRLRGDIPTWLLVVVAAIAGWIALSQLRQQQKVIEEDIARRQKRDDLLEGQLRELAERGRDRQREQAEQVSVIPWPIRLRKQVTGAEAEARNVRGKEEKGSGSCRVANGSSRPVRRISCRLILDGRTILAGNFGIPAGPVPGGGGGSMYFAAKTEEVDSAWGQYLNLLAGEEVMAEFTIPDEVVSYQASRYVVRFTDDAGRRWELDGTMHLIVAPDQEW